MPPTLAPCAPGRQGKWGTPRSIRCPGRSPAGDTGRMGHLDIGGIGYFLPDGRPLLDDVSFRVGDGARVALVGPNGAGKTTLLRIVAGDEAPHAGSVGRSGGLGIMRQDIGRIDDDRSIRDLLASLASPAVRDAAVELAAAELRDHGGRRRARADAVRAGARRLGRRRWVRGGGGLGPRHRRRAVHPVRRRAAPRGAHAVRRRAEAAGPGGAAARSRTRCCCSTSPTTPWTCPTKRWLEDKLRASNKTVLFVSHDREMLARVATQVATLEPGVNGAAVWVHGGGFATYHQAREDRRSRLEELLRRWEEEHAKLKELVLTLKTKAAFNDGLASRYSAAQTRLRKFEEAGPPTLLAREQNVKVRLRGGRTAKRAVVATGLELTGLMKPFDLEVWFGERVAVLGSNGSGKSHFLRLLAAGGSDPSPEHAPADDIPVAPVTHTGRGRARPARAAGLVRAEPRAPRARRPDAAGDPAPRRGAPGRARPRAGQQGARPVRARRRGRAALRDAVRRSAGAPADPPARARRERRCCCSTSRPTTSTCTPRRRSRPGWPRSRARSWRSRTTAGSRGRSTGSSCSARTARSSRRRSPCGTSGASTGCADASDAAA